MEELFREASEILKLMGHRLTPAEVAEHCKECHEDYLAMIDPAELAGMICDYMEKDV